MVLGMAAITPFLGRQTFHVSPEGDTVVTPEPADLESPAEEALQLPAEVSEAGGGGVDGLGRAREVEEVLHVSYLNAEALAKSHAELLQTAWVRKFVFDHLRGRKLTVVVTPRPRLGTSDIHLVLDGPMVRPDLPFPAWNPPASPDARRFSLLSWTSKMGCPSFSLPAGPIETGGSCPGAAGGQTIVPRPKLLASADLVRKFVGRPVRLQQAVCQYCYAEGGQYGTAGVQFAQAVTYAWTLSALQDGSFVDVMVHAIENADYKLDGGKVDKNVYEPETFPGRFFRWHDSGDIFSPKHLEALVEIARRCPTIHFWAPTRIWATTWGVRRVNEIAEGPGGWPPNFALRPSAYVVNDPPPDPTLLGPGWTAGSVVFNPEGLVQPLTREAALIDWQCPTYALGDDETASCRNAPRPDGQGLGCRACWLEKQAVVNYLLH